MSLSPVPMKFDWRGLSCPAPILETARAARQIGDQPAVLEILADDPAFPTDMKGWCRASGAQLVDIQQRQDGSFQARVALNADRISEPPRQAQDDQQMQEIDRLFGEIVNEAQSTQADPVRLMDFRGMSCPGPIVELARMVRDHDGSQCQWQVMADDPAFPLDLKGWIKHSPLQLDHLEELPGGQFRAMLSTRTSHAPAVSSAPIIKSQPPVQAAQPMMTPIATPPRPKRPAAPSTPSMRVPTPQPPAASKHADAAMTLELDPAQPEVRTKRLKAVENLGLEGQKVVLRCANPAFSKELMKWCSDGGHELIEMHRAEGSIEAILTMGHGAPETTALAPRQNAALAVEPQERQCTLLVLHNEFEALMASLMTANAAAATGMKVRIFFSFWGVNLLRGEKAQGPPKKKPSFLQRVFKWLMPTGPGRQQLGKLNFGGFGTNIMRGIMAENNIMGLPALMEAAKDQGVEFVICTTSMTIMGIDSNDLMPLPNLDYGGVAAFVDASRTSDMSLVF